VVADRHLEQTALAADDTSAEETAGNTDGIDGTWTVDTSVSEFSVTEETTATFAGFRVEEVLTTVGSTTAVGRTPAVSGSIDISGSTLESVQIVADLTELVSDQQRRDVPSSGRSPPAPTPTPSSSSPSPWNWARAPLRGSR
jgi:hypothetical protein